MSVASIIDPTTGKIRPEYIPPAGGGLFLPLAGGTMDASPAGVINAHTIEGLITLEGTPAGSLLDTTILTNTGNDLNLTTDVGDAVNVNSGNMIIGLNNLFEVNATANTRIVADGATDEVKLKATTFTFEGVPASAPALANVLAYDTGTGEVKYQPAGGGGGGGLVYETLSGITASSVNADTTTITDGSHALPTIGATQGKVKTITSTQTPVFTPLLGSTGLSSGSNLRWFNPNSQTNPIPQVWDIVEVNNALYPDTIAIVGNFTTLPVVSGVPTTTNGKGIFLYNKTTGAMTTLGTGLTINTSIFSGPSGGGKAFYIASSDRLYVFGGFSSAGGVANTIGCAYWDFALATWVSLGTGCLQGTNPYVFGAFQDGTDIYVLGEFNTVNNVVGTFRVAKLDTTTNTWSAIGGGLSAGNNARGGFKLGSDLYFYGGFTSASPASAGYATNENSFLTKWDGVGYSPVGKPAGSGTGFNAVVNGACANSAGTKIYVVGGFQVAPNATTGVQASSVAEYDIATNTWTQMGTGFAGSANTIKELSTGELVAIGASADFAYGYGTSVISYGGLAYYTPGVSTNWVAKGGGLGFGAYNLYEITPTEYWVILTGSVSTIFRNYGSYIQVYKADLTKVAELTGSFAIGNSINPATGGTYILSNLQLAQNFISRLEFNGTYWNWDGVGAVASY